MLVIKKHAESFSKYYYLLFRCTLDCECIVLRAKDKYGKSERMLHVELEQVKSNNFSLFFYFNFIFPYHHLVKLQVKAI